MTCERDWCLDNAVKKKVVEKKTHSEDDIGAISMKATDQLTLKDYVLKYIDEDEEEGA